MAEEPIDEAMPSPITGPITGKTLLAWGFAPGAWFKDAIPAAEAATLDETAWWDLFDDPRLQELIRIALVENRNLKIAVESCQKCHSGLVSDNHRGQPDCLHCHVSPGH